MKKFIPAFIPVLLPVLVFAQSVTGKLTFDQGQTYGINVAMKTTISQQAGGQSIDFVVEAGADHAYTVTNATDDNTTLNHLVRAIAFKADVMGQKINFDSRNEKDLNGRLGKPVQEMLGKKYAIIIDTGGKVLMAMPDKIDMPQLDSRMALVTNLLKDVLDLVQPPAKGGASFFKIFPEGVAQKGATWTTAEVINGGKRESAYVIKDITDSDIVVDFAENATTTSKAEIMGSETTTRLTHKGRGTILVDRATGLIRQKTSDTESTGNTEGGFGTIPVTSKSSTTITVKKE